MSGEDNDYNTPLTTEEAKAYGLWFSGLPKGMQQGGTKDYDLQGAFKAGLNPGETGHLPDTYKKPSHITFSHESIYSGDGDAQGGEWDHDAQGNWTFAPGPANLAHHTPQELQQYFDDYEPDAKLILPKPGALDVLFPEGKK